MTFIPPRDRPVDAQKMTDPVTGAKYLRRRRRSPTPDPDACNEPWPRTCTMPSCAYYGFHHEQCAPRHYFPPAWYPYPMPRIPLTGYTSYDRPPPQLPQANAYSSADQSAFKQWLMSFPHWMMPREKPPGWTFPGYPQLDDFPGAEPQNFPIQPQFTPFRPAKKVPYQEPVVPGCNTPYRRPQATRANPAPVSGGVWQSSDGLPCRVPDVMEWNDVQGGKLQWTPHPWVAHPLPHPEIPARQFWDHSGTTGVWPQWRGPGGWMPGVGPVSQDVARMHLITGGHPLPGQDPYWTPTSWVPPLYSQPSSVIISVWLAPNPRDARIPHVLWDAAVEPPYRIRRVSGRGGVVDFANTDFFKTPATWPHVKRLQIQLPRMRNSWGPVVIEKKSTIEVADVFNAVWDYLQKPITLSDYDAILASGGWERCKKIQYAMYRRCWSSAALYDYTVSQGIKRVDLLEGSSVYWGIWVCYNPDGSWYLSVGFLPRSRSA